MPRFGYKKLTKLSAKASRLCNFAGAVVFIAALWGFVYNINAWLFENLEITSHVNWIFLPAAIRLISVMVLGWPAAIGLFLGSMLLLPQSPGITFTELTSLSILNAAGPMLAVGFCMRWLGMPADLRGIRPAHLAVFSVFGALCNVIPQRLYMWSANKINSPLDEIVPMFIGDLFGTVILLYIVAVLLRLLPYAGTDDRSQG